MAAPNKHKGYPLVSYQPVRIFYQLAYTATVILRLPYYVFMSLFPFLRVNKDWTFKQNLTTRLVYRLLDATARVGITETLSLEPGKEGDRFQTIPVSTKDIYKGPLLSDEVKPAKIGGTWYPQRPGAGISSKTVVLYFHGGAFVQGDGRTETCGPIANYFLEKGTADAVFCLQYRLSGYGGMNPFPAALQDAMSSYVYLLEELKIPPQQIIVAGDSAGGNLTSAMLRYLNEFGSSIKVPTPKCAILHSPWVDPSYSDPRGNPQAVTDFLPTTYGIWGMTTYGGTGADPKANPYIIQQGNPFSTPVPLLVTAGTEELFYGHIVQWSREMQGVQGNSVEIYHEKGAPHDTFLIAKIMGFEKSVDLVAEKMAEFVKGL